MDKIIPNQSGMDFIANNSFHIEEADVYKNIGEGIRSVEFIRAKNDMLLFVEAKTSFPNPNNPDTDNKARFQKEIDEIREKFIHSLNLFSSIELGVSEADYSSDFLKPKKVSIVFLLVIKNHEFKWCSPIKKKLDAELPHYLKTIWKPTIYVVNQQKAREQGFIVS